MMLRYFIIDTQGSVDEVTTHGPAVNVQGPGTCVDTLQGSLHIDGLVREGLTDAYEDRGLEPEDMRAQEALCLQQTSTEIVLTGTDNVRYQVVLDYMSHKFVYRPIPHSEALLVQHGKDMLHENALFAATPNLCALVKGKLVLGRIVVSFREMLGHGRTEGEEGDTGWRFVDVAQVAAALEPPVAFGDAPLGEALRGHVMEPVLVAALQQQVSEMRADLPRLEASGLERDALLLQRYRAVLPVPR